MTTTATLSMRAGVAFSLERTLLRPLFGIVMIFVGIVGANGSVIMPALFVDAGRQVAELGLFSSMMRAGGLAWHLPFMRRSAPDISAELAGGGILWLCGGLASAFTVAGRAGADVVGARSWDC